MRRNLKAMMQENEGVTDIEKLNRYEFDLDVEEQARLQAEGEAEVSRVSAAVFFIKHASYTCNRVAISLKKSLHCVSIFEILEF